MSNYIKKRTVYCPIDGCNYTGRVPILGDLGRIGKASSRGHSSFNCPIHRTTLIPKNK